jgi:hypothetical protein
VRLLVLEVAECLLDISASVGARESREFVRLYCVFWCYNEQSDC